MRISLGLFSVRQLSPKNLTIMAALNQNTIPRTTNRAIFEFFIVYLILNFPKIDKNEEVILYATVHSESPLPSIVGH
jgi:hypothetical protein